MQKKKVINTSVYVLFFFSLEQTVPFLNTAMAMNFHNPMPLTFCIISKFSDQSHNSDFAPDQGKKSRAQLFKALLAKWAPY